MLSGIVAGAFKGLLVVVVVVLGVACDPVDRRPGVWLTGEVVPTPENWAFTDDHQEVFVETATWYGIPHSVTTVVAVADGRLYVPSIYQQPGEFPGTKFWNKNIARNPEVRLKIGEVVYELRAQPVTNDVEFQRGFEALADKYDFWKRGLHDPDARPEFALIRIESREHQLEENMKTTELNDGRNSLNALEQTASHGPINHLPVWSGVRAPHVEPGIRMLLGESEASLRTGRDKV